jgi:prophage regulatory protein
MSLETNPTTEHLLPMKGVEARTGLSRSSIYRLITDKKFPEPIQLDLGTRTRSPSRWVASEIDEWVSAQIAARRNLNIDGEDARS